ncbi:MAG: sulfite exporter TauE/SafE family protein [Candidatus Puniceispirillaceae bacterium]
MFYDQIIVLMIPLLLTGLLSGFMAGLLGVGGGIIIVPIMAFLLDYSGIHTTTPMHMAVGSSLAVIVPTSLISARSHYRLGNIDAWVLYRLGPFVFLGAFGGAVLASLIDNQALKVIFGTLAVLIGVSFLIKIVVILDGLPPFFGRIITGGLIGLISSLIGIGGGLLTVPTLLSCGWDMRKAVGTSALMGLVIAIPGMISFILVGFGATGDLPFATGYVWWPAVLIIATGAYVTAPIGAKLSSRVDKILLRRIFACFLILVGGRLVYMGLQSPLF